jgi:mRNA interferase RelE/StbE
MSLPSRGYDVVFARSAERQLRKLPSAVRARIVQVAERLAADPRPTRSVKLAGSDGLYRVRAGDYRIIYQVADEELIVLIVRVAHRKDAYGGAG